MSFGNITYLKKRTACCVLLLILLMSLTACGKPQSAKSLYRTAKATHGKCTIVSKTETADKTEVVLHDKLQDFDYTVTSGMNDIVIDGSSFGSLPSSTDGFTVALMKKVISNVQSNLDAACSDPSLRYGTPEFYSKDLILIVYCKDQSKGKTAAVECARALQTQNLKNRMDGFLIYLVEDTGGKWTDGEHYGSVKLPDTSFRTPEDEKIDYYTEIAHMQTDPKAKYLRKRTGTFSETGLDLNLVVNNLGSDYPTKPSSPVTFYYFEDSKGREYYICDFNYYDKNNNIAWFTNYAGE